MTAPAEGRSYAGANGALATFFSSEGRSSISRMLVVGLATLLVLWTCTLSRWEYGVLVNVLVGAIAGAAIGKFGVEARRRVRDAGFNMQLVGWVWLVLGLLELVSWLAFLESDPDWSQWLFLGLNFVVPLVAAVFLLAPSRRGDLGSGAGKPRFWRGPAFGAACILSGMAVAAALTAYANGVRDAIERRAQFEASRPESAR